MPYFRTNFTRGDARDLWKATKGAGRAVKGIFTVDYPEFKKGISQYGEVWRDAVAKPLYNEFINPSRSGTVVSRRYSAPQVGGTRFIGNQRLIKRPLLPAKGPAPKRLRLGGGGSRRMPIGGPWHGPKRKRTYFTTGIYSGRFRKGRRPKYTKFSKYGAILRTEKGGVVSNDKCVYIGHSNAPRSQLALIFCQALVRHLAAKNGMEFSSFKDKIQKPQAAVGQSPGDLFYTYQTEEDQELTTATVALTNDMTWEALASTLRTSFQGFATGNDHPRLHEMWFVWETEDVAAQTAGPPRRLLLANAYIQIWTSSEITIQNRTLANTTANPEHHDSMLDVENNPLEGKSYYTNTNGFIRKWRNAFGASKATGFIANDSTGLINVDPDDAQFSSEETALLQRPPLPNMFYNTKGYGKIRLGPGHLKRNTLVSRWNVSVNQFFRKMEKYFKDINEDGRVFYGKSQMYAFEKMMHTTDAEEPDLNIGYEINNIFKARIYSRKANIQMTHTIL